MDFDNELRADPPAVISLGDSLTSTEDMNLLQKQKHDQDVEDKDENPDFSQDDSSLKTDATVKNSLHESPVLPDLSVSQKNVDLKSTKKKRKRQKTENNAVDVNGCCTPENTFSPKSPTPALDMPPEHPIQCISSDAVMTESGVEADICLGENEEKEQNMLGEVAEKNNEECDIQDEGCNCNSVVADAELIAKESVLEVVKMNTVQSIIDNTSNPEGTSAYVKNESLVTNHDEDLEVHDSCDTSQCIKIYSRKKLNNVSCKSNSDSPSPVNCNREPTMQKNNNDDSHKFSDGPLTDGFMERETEHSTDQSKVEAEEIELMTENTSEQRSIATSSVVDIPVTQLEETSARLGDHAEVSRNDLFCPGDVSGSSLVTVNDGNSKFSQFSVNRTIISNSKNKLLILDVNGLLADCVSDVPNGYYQPEPDFWLKRRKVYKRPFCDDFLQFCFDRFHVGIWSSRAKCNVDEVVKFLLGKSASKLLFQWNQSHCTTTRFSTVENRDKPLALKELRKLWEKQEPDLPWEKGDFNESNTLLLDDSPYKALVNPMYTAIFPYSYRYYHTRDSSLGPKGDLRVYLEKLAMADNIQEFVSSNPFGQRPIREANPSWGYYLKVIESLKCMENDRPSSSSDREKTT